MYSCAVQSEKPSDEILDFEGMFILEEFSQPRTAAYRSQCVLDPLYYMPYHLTA